MTRTNSDIQKTKRALEWIGNQPKGEKAKAGAYNALQLRVQLAVEAYRPLSDAIAKTEKAMFQRYEQTAGDERKYLENGNISFGITRDRELMREQEELLDAPVEDAEPRRRAFTLSDFDTVGIAVPQFVMNDLGPLMHKPPASDPDAIDDVQEDEAV